MDAPPVLIFSLDTALSEQETEELAKIEALERKSNEDASRWVELKKKIQNYYDGDGFLNWIPIVIDADISQIAPSGFEQETQKKIKIVSSKPVLTGTMNTVTIHLTTNNGILVNALIGFADFLFKMEDSFPRIHFISKEVVAIGCSLVSMTRSVSSDTTQQLITLQLQKGNDGKLPTGKTAKKPTELLPMDGPPA